MSPRYPLLAFVLSGMSYQFLGSRPVLSKEVGNKGIQKCGGVFEVHSITNITKP
jgi:hypothetical protein